MPKIGSFSGFGSYKSSTPPDCFTTTRPFIEHQGTVRNSNKSLIVNFTLHQKQSSITHKDDAKSRRVHASSVRYGYGVCAQPGPQVFEGRRASACCL
ncbi:minichromosome maintenance (MCM2/3/5) family protein [Actinidia rufa]|uniref:Minichromosome maintenance (MCM2/3/5) family protein n=1 Tax=Actinidia rufa TaxID=165716 RepID=A0A7J0EQ56_9ERIC|nr:minichromosome maintenance (MCM2/3/5) family protein [Actinidia rufa]